MNSLKSIAGTGAMLAMTLAAPALGQTGRGSGIQCTPDNSAVLVNKDVGGERWVITFNQRDGFTTGNVIGADGSVTFLACNFGSIENGEVALTCGTSGSCSDTSCPAFEGSIPTSVNCSFFSAPCAPIPLSPGLTNSRTCSGTPARFPYDSEASCQMFARSGGCASYTYGTDSCAVENCCSPPDCP